MTVAKTSIAPWLNVPDGQAALTFYRDAFEAHIVYRLAEAEPGVIARLAIGDAEFWISDDGKAGGNSDLGGGSVRMVLIVDDPVVLLARAIKAGATEVFPVGEDHGWKLGRITDPFGLDWEIGHPVEAR